MIQDAKLMIPPPLEQVNVKVPPNQDQIGHVPADPNSSNSKKGQVLPMQQNMPMNPNSSNPNFVVEQNFNNPPVTTQILMNKVMPVGQNPCNQGPTPVPGKGYNHPSYLGKENIDFVVNDIQLDDESHDNIVDAN